MNTILLRFIALFATAIASQTLAPDSSATWSEFLSHDGGFVILFPGQSTASQQNIAMPGQSVTLHIQRLVADAEYSVMWADYPFNLTDPATLDRFLDLQVAGALAQSGNTLVSQAKSGLDGHACRDLHERETSGKTLHAKMCLVGRRQFQVAITYPSMAAAPDGAEAKWEDISRRFLDSFRLLPDASTPAVKPIAPEATPYSRLVDRLEAGDRTVDFTALRLAFARTPAYNGMMMGVYQPLWQTLNAGRFEEALRVADAVLARNYAEPNAHMVAAKAHRELGHVQQADFHQFVVDGLLRSIVSGGDGKTAETAYQVIDISEEYAYFRSMNLKVKGQSLVGPPASGRPNVDRMVVVDGGTNEERVIFFSVENPTTIRR